MWRNRVRHELLPLANEIAGRDVTPILTRTADLLRDEAQLLDELAAGLDPTDARAHRRGPDRARPPGAPAPGSPSTDTRPTRPASSA